MKILFFITELSTGGAQTAMFRLLSNLDRNSFMPIVCCLYNSEGTIGQQIQASGTPVIDLGMTSKWRLDALWRLYQLLRQEYPHILHSWMFHANIPARILGRLAGVPVIITSERTMGQESWGRLLINRYTVFLANQVVCVSQQVATFAAQTIGIPADKLVVIPNGVSSPQFLAKPSYQNETVIIGTVGRLQPVKGMAYLLQALALLTSTYSNLQLMIVGDGPLRSALTQMAQDLGISAQVVFLGDRTDVAKLLAQMHIFVLPSVWEGMPNAVLEAMAAGLPVVATAVGGTPEVVQNTVTGLLVPPSQPGSLAAALEQLIRNPLQRVQMGQAGRDRLQKMFTVEQMVRSYENLYSELVLQVSTEAE